MEDRVLSVEHRSQSDDVSVPTMVRRPGVRGRANKDYAKIRICRGIGSTLGRSQRGVFSPGILGSIEGFLFLFFKEMGGRKKFVFFQGLLLLLGKEWTAGRLEARQNLLSRG